MTNARNEHSSNKNKIILLKKKKSFVRLTFFIIKNENIQMQKTIEYEHFL
jgi:hypothetical protein